MPISKITGSAIADDSITSARLDDGTIVAVDLASDAVTTAKIANSAVTNAKIDGMASSKLSGAISVDGSSSDNSVNIDSSDNLLVGKTSTSINTAGHTLFPSGYADHIRDGDVCLRLNRQTSDGEILNIRKDGTSVGSIGSQADYLYIGGTKNTDTHIGFVNGAVRPANSDGTSLDNTLDLGNSGGRWNDLYLGGGVYVGGTTSSNYLDDYEEGTWTPVYKGTSGDPTCTYDFQEGLYVKVGRLVTAKFKLGTDAASGGSGNLRVGGLPFTPAGDYSGILGTEFSFATTGTIARLGNGNSVGIRVDDDEGNAVSPSILGNGTNDNRLFGTIIYETDA